jgi:predicted TIM-barrel fold metal-dependent hydrolase
MWESDFPHPTSTYPHSRKAIESSLAEVPADEQKKMVETNAARLFKIDVAALDLPDSCVYVA